MTPGHPPDDALRAADRIVLIDPRVPGWYRPLFVRLVLRDAATIEIPVDSTDLQAIQAWQDRIRALNLDE